MQDGVGMRKGGSKKCKPIPTLPHGTGLKSCPICTPPPLQGGENPCKVKWEGMGQNCHPYYVILPL